MTIRAKADRPGREPKKAPNTKRREERMARKAAATPPPPVRTKERWGLKRHQEREAGALQPSF